MPTTNKKNSDKVASQYPSSHFINRDLSWIAFNRRVLDASMIENVPVLERLKFCSIVSSNLDEFFMVRMGSLQRILKTNIEHIDPSGLTINAVLSQASDDIHQLVKDQYRSLSKDVFTQLEKSGIQILAYNDLSKSEKARLNTYFEDNIFPLLTPFAVDAGHPFPFLGNLKLNIMVIFKDFSEKMESQAYAFVEVPAALPRCVPITTSQPGEYHFVLIEDLIVQNIHLLFPGMEIAHTAFLRVTRNHNYQLHESDVLDLASSVQSELRDRDNQSAVRVELSSNASKFIMKLISENMDINKQFIYMINGPLNICDFLFMNSLPGVDKLKDPPFNPRLPPRFAHVDDIFSVIRDGDALLHHPFDSFSVVTDFINAAADDPDVLAIKQTLYRVGSDSPIITALRRAAMNGKQVTAVVELKARFDEVHNIDWALKLREAGVDVVFGFVRWKTHCKATLVVRREGKYLKRYIYLSTGNYNIQTARQYTDIGLLTCNPDFGKDVSTLFNVLTGFNSWSGKKMFSQKKVASMFKQIMISPVNTYTSIIDLIKREIEKSTAKNPGRIIVKMNALVDPNVIEKLYEASQAGVKIDLIIRGICCLRPGVPGLSDNITVTSIIDRFLEHSRIYYFHNGGTPVIFSGSADWMPRSFFDRVEIIYPILDNELKSHIINKILMVYMNDNTRAWSMQADGSYVRKKPKEGVEAFRSQHVLIAYARSGGVKSMPYEEAIKKIGKKKKFKKYVSLLNNDEGI